MSKSIVMAALMATALLSVVPSPTAGHAGPIGRFSAQHAVDSPTVGGAPAAGGVQSAGPGADAAADELGRATGNPAMMKHRLKAFLADLEVAAAPYRDDENSGDRVTFEQAMAAVDELSDLQAAVIYEGLAEVIVAWHVADAVPTTDAAERLGPAAYTSQEIDELEDLRARILAYYDRFPAVADVTGSVDPHFEERLANLRESAEALTIADLERIDEDMAPIPTWETMLDVDPASFLPAPGAGGHGESGTDAAAPDAPAGLNTDIHPECADFVFGPVVVQVLDYLANTAEDLSEIWSNDFFIAAAGFGSNAPNIPRIVTMAIYYPLRIVAMAAQLEQDLVTNCNEWFHQELLAEHDLEMLEITDLISGTLTAHDLDIGVRADRVDEFHTRFREMEVRLALEKDLLRKGDKRISIFQIPDSLCITTDEHEVCGMLEVARDRVDDTIRIARELGLETTEAEVAFDDAESQRGLGLYKEAYTRYREAYVLAVRAE